jgi:hypothetical protein
MPLHCLIVDDYQPFLKVAQAKLERQGMAVVGVASNGARQISAYVGCVILISSNDYYGDDDYAELIAGSPAVGFLSKATLSSDAISGLVS